MDIRRIVYFMTFLLLEWQLPSFLHVGQEPEVGIGVFKSEILRKAQFVDYKYNHEHYSSRHSKLIEQKVEKIEKAEDLASGHWKWLSKQDTDGTSSQDHN